jgi:hypothetical protein
MAELNVTPQLTITDDTVVDAAVLNQLAQPGVALEPESIVPGDIDMDALKAAVSDSLRIVNWLPWGNFGAETFRGVTVACPVNVRTPVAAGWWVLPVGASITAERVAEAPDAKSTTCLRMPGIAALTSTSAGTYLPPSLTEQLAEEITVSAWVRQQSAGGMDVQLVLEGSSTLGSETALNAAVPLVASVTAPSGTWTRVSWTFEGSDVTGWKNGCQMSFKSNAALTGPATYLQIAQVQIEIGAMGPYQRPLPRERHAPVAVPVLAETAGGVRLAVVANETGDTRALEMPPVSMIDPVLTWRWNADNVTGFPYWKDNGTSKYLFSYTGGEQTVTVPAGRTKMRVKLWGAPGGQETLAGVPIKGGSGGYTAGEITVTPGTVYKVIVGAPGRVSIAAGAGAGTGFGGADRPVPPAGTYGAGGGGLTGIFTDGAAITAADAVRAVFIAGGGAGASDQPGGVVRYAGGNDGSAAGGTMAGTTAVGAADGYGGGGGGWKGGGVGQGGSGFLAAGATGTALTTGGLSLPNAGDTDYAASAGAAERLALAVIEFLP